LGSQIAQKVIKSTPKPEKIDLKKQDVQNSIFFTIFDRFLVVFLMCFLRRNVLRDNIKTRSASITVNKSERITKFNFEEVAEDDNFLDHHFESIHIKIWDMFGLQLTLEEQEDLHDHLLNKLYELLNEDIQDHRESERP